ncbi:hypothetical protein EPUS_07557 [Endocarpon pusillum Z07020]|uniref:Uncharacterized protein n=1 Tax=Endocarpon pusillum (strain Z07020 / HMAS-L-300199) TaxID=1263415 RepID=U1HPR5_ENDPU|nr:uncharacterized protein EPUS_07557 [Endocarpon pusillum Z07020]ERF72395.1 hypothetical protein EPUS_07557 [Endocarpon pusillum Z07020]
MANHRAVTEIPRFLLPRITWSQVVAKGATSQLTPKVRTHVNRPAPPPLHRLPQIRPLNIISSPQLAHITHQRPAKFERPSVQRIPVPANAPPIRHNGVYVATFKPAKRAFSTSRSHQKDHHFDTLKFVQRLKGEGFSEEQAVAMMRVLNDVIEESIQNLTRTMVLKEDAERSAYTQKVDFAKLRSELMNSDSTETQLTRSSHERLSSDLAKLSSRLRDEISRTQASVRLDLNLEKGRIREEANGQEMRIKETEARIEQEVAGLRERVEAVKFSTLQWLM